MLTRFPPQPHPWLVRKGGECLRVQGGGWEGRRRLRVRAEGKRRAEGEAEGLGLAVPSGVWEWLAAELGGGESRVQG